MDLKTFYKEYKNIINESVFKKVKSVSDNDIENRIDSGFIELSYKEKISFLLTALCRGRKDRLIVPLPYHLHGNKSDYYKPDDVNCLVNYLQIYFNPSKPDTFFFYCLYKNLRGGGYCSSDIVEEGGESYSKEPEGRFQEAWKYSTPDYAPEYILEAFYNQIQFVFDHINTGEQSWTIDNDCWGIPGKYSKKPKDPERQSKMLKFALKKYPNKKVCDYYRYKYEHII